MSSRVKLAVTGSSLITNDWPALAARSQAVELVESPAESAAVITDDEQLALTLANARQCVLLVNPFDADEQAHERLHHCGRSMPAQVWRFRPSITQVKQALDAGKLGDPGLMRVHYWGLETYSEAALAGQLDLALWMFGGMPTELYAIERPDYRQVHLGFEGGGMAMIDLDASSASSSDYYSLSLIGSSGAAYADDHHNMHLHLGQHEITALRTSQADPAVRAMIDEFATAIRDDRDFLVDWSDMRVALQLAAAVKESAQQQDIVVRGVGRG